MPKTTRASSIVVALTILACLFINGCAVTATKSDMDAALNGQKGGIVVVEMESQNYAVIGNFAPRVDIGIVKVNGEEITRDIPFADPTGSLNDGFAIFPLPESRPGEAYVVLMYGGHAGGAFFPVVCANRKTPTFQIKNGDFVYVGHYSVTQFAAYPRIQWHVSFKDDFPAALSRVQKLFPSAAERLSSAHLDFKYARFGAQCG